jgi:hypothetical protein
MKRGRFGSILVKRGRFYFCRGNPKRPLVQLSQKIIEAAAINYQPFTLRSWKETQESGYLGETIKE